MILRGHMRNAYVAHDLDRAMEIVGNRFGVQAARANSGWQRRRFSSIRRRVSIGAALIKWVDIANTYKYPYHD